MDAAGRHHSGGVRAVRTITDGLPLDTNQCLELLLTAAQSLYTVSLLVNRQPLRALPAAGARTTHQAKFIGSEDGATSVPHQS